METQSNNQAIPVIVYKDLRVITAERLAILYGTHPQDLLGVLHRNAQSFTKGRHYFWLECDELYDFNNSPESQNIGEKQNIRLILWTNIGAARLANLLIIDEAWDAYECLEADYFSVMNVQPDSLANIAFRASHIDIKQAVRRLADISHLTTTAIYRRLNARFDVDSYKDIPLEQCPAAVEYLKKLEDQHFDMLKKSKLNNLAILASDTTNKVHDYIYSLHGEIERLGGTSPNHPEFDKETIVRAVVTRMVDMSRMLLTFSPMDGKARVSFIPNDSWILHDKNIVDIIRDSSGVNRKLLPDIINAAADRLGCR